MFAKRFTLRAGPAATAVLRSGRAGGAMPLRAKILPQAAASRAAMSTDSNAKIFEPVEGDEAEDVLFTSLYGLRTIELNRPKKLNSLNGSMIRKIAPRLIEWEKSDMANVVVLKGAGPKALCAGGDVAALAKWNTEGEEGQKKSVDYFALEYQLDHLISTYQKPYISFMDGITMGGGVGLSIHAPFRIATERTLFAMPETTIGFFPDVGASFFLPRMSGALGTYLALTSSRLDGVNAFFTGVATHYLHSTSLPNLEARLAELRFRDYDSLATRLGLINATIEEFCTGLPHDVPMTVAGETRKAIDRCFSKDNVNAIIAALKEETGPTKEWAEKTLEVLHQRSPTGVHVTLRQMRIGGKWSIAETFKREHQIAAKFMAHPDFTEGVTALLVEKRSPEWKPATLEDVQDAARITEPFFQVSRSLPELELWNDRNYQDYPFKFGLPTEQDVEAVVREGTLAQGAIVAELVKRREGKQGVKEAVKEIVARKTTKDEDGKARWLYEE